MPATYGEQTFGEHYAELADTFDLDVSDATDLARVKRWVNRGLKMVARGAYVDRRGITRQVAWIPLVKDLALTTVASQAYSACPADFGRALTTLGVDETTMVVEPVTLDRLNAMQTTSLADITSYPQAFTPIYDATGKVYRVLWWPIPSGVYTITGKYLARVGDLSGTSDAVPFPGEFHELVQLAARVAAAGSLERKNLSDERREFYEEMELMAASYGRPAEGLKGYLQDNPTEQTQAIRLVSDVLPYEP